MAGKSLLDGLMETVRSLSKLQIYTVVGDVTCTVGADKANPTKATLVPPKKGVPTVFTEIDLAQGDLTTMIHEEFTKVDDPIQALHFQQVKQARQIVATNFETIRRLAESASAAIQGILMRPESSQPSD